MSENTFKSLKTTIISLQLTTRFYLSLCNTLQSTFKAYQKSFSTLSTIEFPPTPISPLPFLKTFKSKQEYSSKALKIISHYSGLFLTSSISLNSCREQIKFEKSLHKSHQKSAPISLQQAEKAFKMLVTSVKHQQLSLTQLIDNFSLEFTKIDSPPMPHPRSLVAPKLKNNEKSLRSSSVSTLKKFY